jgi:GDSL-like Lipase/Acylhydrolase family
MMRHRWRHRSRRSTEIQGRLPFAVRAERRERTFKREIVGLTALMLLGIVAGTPQGRDFVQRLTIQPRIWLPALVGLPADRQLIEQRQRSERLRNAASAREALGKAFAPGSAIGTFLQIAGMDARSAVIRWGNVDRPIVLSSAVFEPDDARAYRLKPGVRAVWVIGLSFKDGLAMFLIPDTPEARAAACRVGGIVVAESVQTTNSWGCRGPEPDLNAPVRVLVLGDSMMQGSLVGDTETPPARLGAHLSQALKAPVSVLNTGHIGYSPEQYEQTLRAFGDRFRPHFVVLSIAENDFGDLEVGAGWAEGEYWIDRIRELCGERQWDLLLVPAPIELSLLARRDLSKFQGQISRIFKRAGRNYIDPLEAFTDELLRRKAEGERQGVPVSEPLYNLHLLGDRHFSPIGADVWARVVARRMLLTWDLRLITGYPGPEPVARHARSPHPALPGDDVSE